MTDTLNIPAEVIPLKSENLTFSRAVTSGETVRVETFTHEREQNIDELIYHEKIEVTRIPVGREIESAPEIIENDDLTILPVVEEILVLTRKLILKEEVHIRRIKVPVRHQETVALRSQDAIITRIQNNQSSASAQAKPTKIQVDIS